MGLIPKSVENAFNATLTPLVKSVQFLHLSPNMISTIGVVPSIIAAFLLAYGEFVLGGVFILLGGVLDMIDGKLARLTNRVSKFGALYDSTLDRFAEIAMYTGLGYYFVFRNMNVASLMVVIAASGSIMISYVRARAESHGFTCNVGWLRRGERIVILGAGALLSFFPQPFDQIVLFLLRIIPFDLYYAYPPMPITLAIGFIAIFSQLTVIQRVRDVWKQTRSEAVIQKYNPPVHKPSQSEVLGEEKQ